MPNLAIAVLGTPGILVDDQPLLLQPRNSIRARAILYLLAATGQPQSRERLAGLLWSDTPEKKARDYLRGEIHLLAPLRSHFLQERDGRLWLEPDTCTIDLQQFRSAAAVPRAEPELLAEALALYRGPFLDGLESAIESSAGLYIDWIYETRSELEGLYQRVLYQLTESCATFGRRLDLGIDAALRLLALQPEREEVHRLQMRLLALDGQRAAALKQYDVCTAALLDELGVPPSAETNTVYDQILSGELGPIAAIEVAARKPAPFQAVATPGHYVGRQVESDQLCAWLSQPGTVAAVVGMAGVGKTALAAHVAHRLRPLFPDGVLWATVGGADPLDILQSWAQAYDKDLSKISNPEARAAAMRTLLADKRTLIVLDAVAARSAIDLLLPGASQCAVLVTTRDRAEVAAHTTLIVDLHELSTADGLEMLSYFLGSDQVNAESDAAVRLHETLGGLPLAMEIAAQRVFASPRRSLARMLRSLEDAGERLAQGISNRSVRTSFTVSWAALPAEQQRLFALAGLFDGRSFAPEVAAAIAGQDADDVVDALDQLVTLSMLRLDARERYSQHRLLADFAHEKLAELPDREQVELRFAEALVQLAQMANGDFSRLAEDWENLGAALEVSAQHSAWPILVHGVDALSAPWFARARFPQAQRGLRLGIAGAKALDDRERQARYSFLLGKILLRQDEYSEARQHLDQAIRTFRAQGDRLRLAEAYVDMADVAIEEGENAEARQLLELAGKLYADLHQPVGLAIVNSRLALTAHIERDHGTALRLCEEGLAQLPQNQGAVVRSRILRLLTDIAIAQQRLDAAAEYCRQAQTVNNTLNDLTETAAILYAQAKLDHFWGNDREALTAATASAKTYEIMGDRKASAIVHHFISRLQCQLGERAAARSAAQYGLTIAFALRDDTLIDLCQADLAAALD